jgi:hypothetical protein
MLRKLVVMLMAILFSLSVAGLSYAQTKPSDKPADKPVEKSAPANPCDKGMSKKKKAQNLAEKKAACLEKATTDQAKAECEKKFAEKAKKKVAKKKMGEVPGPVEK